VQKEGGTYAAKVEMFGLGAELEGLPLFGYCK
jgi:hypothetical protein